MRKGAPLGAMGGPGMGGSTDPKDQPVGFSMEAMQLNVRQFQLMRTVMFITGGIICGILGLTGLLGALFYVAISIIANLSIVIVTGFKPQSYFMLSSGRLLGNDVMNFNHMLSFIMFWTLSYALVYIY
jgi:hypothetical protein